MSITFKIINDVININFFFIDCVTLSSDEEDDDDGNIRESGNSNASNSKNVIYSNKFLESIRTSRTQRG